MAARLAGKTAFITAAAQGMGQAAALAFAREGAKVWATDLNGQQVKALEGKEGIRARQLDVTDEAAIARVAQEVGDIEVLFNCAGIVHNGSILDASVKDWDQAFNVNVRSMFLVARASSIRGLPNRCVYGASKAAVIGLTKSIAADYVRQGIRCNALAPGTIDTPSLQGRINSYADPVQARKDFVARQPMGRLGTVEDMTGVMVYLASDESLFATGQVFSIDGGMTI
ncbi:MAG: SDR family oxidoreductase [Betaproteobacteria bacterium]|nr:MAG: SDR family oxidoreductase [Betaproteobacteria bacterium]